MFVSNFLSFNCMKVIKILRKRWKESEKERYENEREELSMRGSKGKYESH